MICKLSNFCAAATINFGVHCTNRPKLMLYFIQAFYQLYLQQNIAGLENTTFNDALETDLTPKIISQPCYVPTAYFYSVPFLIMIYFQLKYHSLPTSPLALLLVHLSWEINFRPIGTQDSRRLMRSQLASLQRAG